MRTHRVAPLSYEDFRQALEAGESLRLIAKRTSRGISTIRYWAKQYGLQSNLKGGMSLYLVGSMSSCRVCGKDTTGKRQRSICASCRQRVRRLRVKMAAVALLGGQCIRCNWSGHLAAYDFHHFSGKKDFQIGSTINKKWEVVLAELKECILLCAVCHRIEHSKQDDPLLLAEMNTYRGRLLS